MSEGAAREYAGATAQAQAQAARGRAEGSVAVREHSSYEPGPLPPQHLVPPHSPNAELTAVGSFGPPAMATREAVRATAIGLIYGHMGTGLGLESGSGARGHMGYKGRAGARARAT